MDTNQDAGRESFMTKLSSFIVDKRNLVFLLIGISLIFSLFSSKWVEVENDLTAFLPAQSATRKGLDVMEEQFTTFGSAKLMVANVSWPRAQEIAGEIALLLEKAEKFGITKEELIEIIKQKEGGKRDA